MATEATIPRARRVRTPKVKDALDPRKAAFLAAYVDPESETFGNALRSALASGYSQEYAENITHKMPDWLAEKVGDSMLLLKAERNLNKMLSLETNLPVIGMFGPMYEQIPNGRDKNGKERFKRGKVVRAENHKLLSIQADVTKFVAERLNKKKFGPRATVDVLSGGEPIKEIHYITPKI